MTKQFHTYFLTSPLRVWFICRSSIDLIIKLLIDEMASTLFIPPPWPSRRPSFWLMQPSGHGASQKPSLPKAEPSLSSGRSRFTDQGHIFQAEAPNHLSSQGARLLRTTRRRRFPIVLQSILVHDRQASTGGTVPGMRCMWSRGTASDSVGSISVRTEEHTDQGETLRSEALQEV